MDGIEAVRRRFQSLEKLLDEKSRRLLAAAESKSWGSGGVSAVSRATGVSRQVIRKGLQELEGPATGGSGGLIRRPGGGRKKIREKDATVVADLEKLVIAKLKRVIDGWEIAASARRVVGSFSLFIVKMKEMIDD